MAIERRPPTRLGSSGSQTSALRVALVEFGPAFEIILFVKRHRGEREEREKEGKRGTTDRARAGMSGFDTGDVLSSEEYYCEFLCPICQLLVCGGLRVAQRPVAAPKRSLI